MASKTWQEIAESMQKHRADTIASVEPAVPDPPANLPFNVTGIPNQLLSGEVVSITDKLPEQLISDLACGKLTSTAVTKAFLQRAGLASKLVNCCTELLPERALERAKFLDEYYSKNNKPIGPLHGLPISVKEHVGMKGLDLNAGFVAWVGSISPDDAVILKLLRNAGCVFYARTTQPQTLMHLETSNNIYGVTVSISMGKIRARTTWFPPGDLVDHLSTLALVLETNADVLPIAFQVNPYNTKLTCGGSSGGEGALMAMRGSCLGIGSDIGGSIRSPAANNGLFGLRPTTFRLPVTGWTATMMGEEQIVPVIGPISRSLEGVKMFMKTLLDQKPWMIEPSLIAIPWKTTSLLRTDSSGKRKLRIGVLSDDGIVKPHPPILRGINTLVEKLKGNPDIDIVGFPPYNHEEAWHIIHSLYFGDAASEEKEALAKSGEPWRPLSKFIIEENFPVKALTVPEVWDLTIQREVYKAKYTRHWNSIGTGIPGPDDHTASTFPDVLAADVVDKMVDVILCPTGPGCAPLLDCSRYWGYTTQWNLLDYPALVFPTGLQCGPEDKVESDYQPRNEKDKYNYELYDPEAYVDAPISLQLVGRRFEDEKVIQALEMMMDAADLPFQPPPVKS